MKNTTDSLERLPASAGSALAWLCETCFAKPRSPIRKNGTSGDKTCAFCPRCGGPKQFGLMDAARQVSGRKTAKRLSPKMTSNRVAESALNNTAVAKGVGIRKKDFGHAANRAVMLRVNQLSDKFERLWQCGLGEMQNAEVSHAAPPAASDKPTAQRGGVALH